MSTQSTNLSHTYTRTDQRGVQRGAFRSRSPITTQHNEERWRRVGGVLKGRWSVVESCGSRLPHRCPPLSRTLRAQYIPPGTPRTMDTRSPACGSPSGTRVRKRERESEMYVTHDNFMRAAVFILKYLCQEEKINTHTVYIYLLYIHRSVHLRWIQRNPSGTPDGEFALRDLYIGPPCPHACHGHGICTAAGLCKCEPGYNGEFILHTPNPL